MRSRCSRSGSQCAAELTLDVTGLPLSLQIQRSATHAAIENVPGIWQSPAPGGYTTGGRDGFEVRSELGRGCNGGDHFRGAVIGGSDGSCQHPRLAPRGRPAVHGGSFSLRQQRRAAEPGGCSGGCDPFLGRIHRSGVRQRLGPVWARRQPADEVLAVFGRLVLRRRSAALPVVRLPSSDGWSSRSRAH
jgi:hypothetical protein